MWYQKLILQLLPGNYSHYYPQSRCNTRHQQGYREGHRLLSQVYRTKLPQLPIKQQLENPDIISCFFNGTDFVVYHFVKSFRYLAKIAQIYTNQFQNAKFEFKT